MTSGKLGALAVHQLFECALLVGHDPGRDIGREVFERALGQQGSRYVWTRKVQAKTITVALSKEQYHWLRLAVAKQRKLDRIVRQMQKLSRQALFQTVPGVVRRKRLSNKVLGLI